MKYAYINGKILDGTKDMQVKEGFVILTDNDKIEDIVKAGTDLNGYEKVDLKRRYIMPGLINMHVHLAGNGKPQKKQRDNEKLVKILMGNALMRSIAYGMVAGFAKTELMSGVTTIRTVGGLGSFDTKLRDEINAGTKMGPRILAANEGISVPGGHMAGSVAVAADSIDTALKHLEQSEKEKVDLIKLMITGGVMDAKEKGVPGELKMSPEMVKVVCDKAHENGYLVAAHVESPQGVRVALENGVDSIEHGAKIDDDTIKLFKERKAFLCTTISPAKSRSLWCQAPIAPMLVDLSICSYGTYIGNVFFYVPPYCPHGTYVKYLFSYVPSLLYNRTYIISFSLYVPPLLYSGTYIISFSLYVSPLLYSGTYITSFSLYVPTTFHQSFSKCW